MKKYEGKRKIYCKCQWQQKQFTLTTQADGRCPNCGYYTGAVAVDVNPYFLKQKDR